jgi:F0F1-type ATP synthase assembly protein I
MVNRQDDGDRGSEGLSPLRFVSIGVELVAPLIAGVFGGRWLDRRFGTEPWLLLVLAVLGAVVGMINLVRRGLPPGDAGAKKS